MLASASIYYFCKTMQIIAFLCYTQIIYNTNTYLWTASNVRIPIITVIITDVWYVRKSHAVTRCMYFYHFITMGASRIFFQIINTSFRYQIIVIISRLCSNRVMCSPIAVHARSTGWWELACFEQAFRAWHDFTRDGFPLVWWSDLSTLPSRTWIWYSVWRVLS